MAIKQSMKAAIAAGSFQHSRIATFTVPIQQLTKAEASRWQQDELSIDGKMYDVVSARQINGQLTIKCVCDENENLLVTAYKQGVENGTGKFPDKSVAGLKYAFSPFIFAHSVVSFLPTEKKVAIHLLQPQTAFVKEQYSGVITPPPRQA